MRRILCFILCAFVGHPLMAQYVSKVTTTTNVGPADLVLVNTNAAAGLNSQKTRTISASNLLDSLKRFDNWPLTGQASNAIANANGIGTNTTLYGPLSLFNTTNGSLTVTQECYVTSQADTNAVVVTGAGTAGVNGTYNYVPGASYHKAGFGFKYDLISHNGWIITNSSGTSLYFDSDEGTDPVSSSWVAEAGANPVPVTIFGDATNCFGSLISTLGFPMPYQGWLFVDAAAGNDTNALRGRLDRPFKTLYGAINHATNNDYIIMGPGSYPSTYQSGLQDEYLPPAGVHIIGSGIGVTRIGTSNDIGQLDEILRLKSDSTVESLSFYGAIYLGGVGIKVTNSTIRDIELIGSRDCVYADTWEGTLDISDCRFLSAFDTISSFDARWNSNRNVRISDSFIETIRRDSAFETMTCIASYANTGPVHWYIKDSHLRAINGNTVNACIFIGAGMGAPTNGSVRLYNVTFDHGDTNSSVASWAIFNTNNWPIYVQGMTLSSNEVYSAGPLNIAGNVADNWNVRSNLFVAGHSTVQDLKSTSYTNSGNTLLQGDLLAGTNGPVTFGNSSIVPFFFTNWMPVILWNGMTFQGNGASLNLNNTNNLHIQNASKMTLGGDSYLTDSVSDALEANRYRLAGNTSGIHSNDVMRLRDLLTQIIAGSNIVITSSGFTNITINATGGGSSSSFAWLTEDGLNEWITE